MRNKKMLSVVLATSMIFSMNSFAYANEVVEVGEYDSAYIEDLGAKEVEPLDKNKGGDVFVKTLNCTSDGESEVAAGAVTTLGQAVYSTNVLDGSVVLTGSMSGGEENGDGRAGEHYSLITYSR